MNAQTTTAMTSREARTLSKVFFVLFGITGMLFAGGAIAADEDAPVSREEYNRVVEELKELRGDIDDVLKKEGSATRSAESEEQSGVLFGPTAPSYRGGVYDKPFLETKSTNVYLGGYFDIEYRNPENAKHDFRFHRLIPFIYGDIHERIRFATEIEFEDGAEVEVEFAHLDFLFTDKINLRGGVILDPLGKFNLIHDSPIRDLTDRPLVNQFVIPTTLREVGVGFFGDLLPEEAEWELKYEAYATSGFKGLASDVGAGGPTITDSGLRNARASKDRLDTRHFGDVNESFSGVGRISLSPLLGTEFGVSAHSGTYDEASDNLLTISAVDGLITLPEFTIADIPVGPIELLGEGAYAAIERDGFAKASGVADDMWGYYTQINYHFMPQFLIDHAPWAFLPESTFTGVLRWGEIDLDGNERTRLTVGCNYRPIESVVFKFDYQFNDGKGSAPSSADDDAFLVSFASFF